MESRQLLPDRFEIGDLIVRKSDKYEIVLDMGQLFDEFYIQFLQDRRLQPSIFSMPGELYMWMHGKGRKEGGKKVFHIKRLDTPHVQKYETIMTEEELKAAMNITRPKKVSGLGIIGGIHNHPIEPRTDFFNNMRPSFGDLHAYTKDMKELRRDGFSGIHVITRADPRMLINPFNRRGWIMENTVAWTWKFTEKELAEKGWPKKFYWVPIRYVNVPRLGLDD